MTYAKQLWSDGEAGGTPITAARLNNMENGIAANDTAVTAINGYPVAFLRQTSAQNNAAGWVSLAMQVADIDTHSGWVSTPNPHRWTVPANQGGIYRVAGSAAISQSTAAAWILSRILKNGIVQPSGAGTGGSLGTTGGGSSYAERLLTLVPGDFVELQGYSDAAWNTRNTVDGIASWFSVERIR